MKVNFNNLRRRLINAYVRTIMLLKEHDLQDAGLNKAADELRAMIAGVACVFEEGNPDFADLGEECDQMPFLDDTEDK